MVVERADTAENTEKNSGFGTGGPWCACYPHAFTDDENPVDKKI